MGFGDFFKGIGSVFGGGGQKPGGGMGSAVGMPMGGQQTPFTGGPAMGGGGFPGMNGNAQKWMQQQGGKMPGGQDHKAYIPVPFGFKDQAQRDQWKQQNDTQRQRVLAGEPDMMRGGNTGISGGLGQAGQLALGSAPGDMKGEKDFGGDASMSQPQTFSQGGAFGASQFQRPRRMSGFRSMRGGRR